MSTISSQTIGFSSSKCRLRASSLVCVTVQPKHGCCRQWILLFSLGIAAPNALAKLRLLIRGARARTQ
ncbi:hypothetical protein [Bartonella sp. CL42QHWL]|uniref:hypothetical protein n=1 Tax=Bartonella sp. CL42QHWL TaxID=3243528 RepID=UPI0035D01622